MLIPTFAGLFIVVALIPPALVWHRVTRRRVPSGGQSFLDLAGVYITGGIFSLASAMLVALLARSLPDAFPDFGELWRSDDLRSYTADNVAQISLAALIWILLSTVLAYFAARALYRGRAATLSPHLTVWYHVLGRARGERDAYLAIHLDDGTILEGALDTYPVDDTDDFAISLQQPIHLRDKDSRSRYRMDNLDRLVVRGDHVSHVGVIYVDPNTPS